MADPFYDLRGCLPLTAPYATRLFAYRGWSLKARLPNGCEETCPPNKHTIALTYQNNVAHYLFTYACLDKDSRLDPLGRYPNTWGL